MTDRYPARLLARVSAPEAEPITLEEVKLYLRVDDDTENALVSAFIVAAREAAEEHMRRCLITQTWKLSIEWPYSGLDAVFGLAGALPLPRGPVQSVSSVIAYDEDDDATAIATSNYRLKASHNALIFKSGITAKRVEVIYISGYGDAASDVPSPIVYGMLAHIGALYDARGGDGGGFPPQTLALYAPYREQLI